MNKLQFLILEGTTPKSATQSAFEKFNSSDHKKSIEKHAQVKGSTDEVDLWFIGDYTFREYTGKPFVVIYYSGYSIVEWTRVTESYFATYEEALKCFNAFAKVEEEVISEQ